MKNKAFILLVIILALIFSIGLTLIYGWKSPLKTGTALTDKAEYGLQEPIKVEIKNNTGGAICFSSCYPYYVERKNNADWKRDDYPGCAEKDVAKSCVGSRQTKAFQISDAGLAAGTYRLAISVCLRCSESQDFKIGRWVYSNAFIIK